MNTIKLPIAEKTTIKDWDFSLSLENGAKSNVDYKSFLPDNAKNYIVIIDGDIVEKNLDSGLSILSPISLDKLREENGLIDINLKNKNSSIKISLEKNKSISEPLYIIYISDSKSLVQQTQILLDAGAELTIIETFIGKNKFNSNIVRNVVLNPNSKLKSTVINRLDGGNTLYYHNFSEVAADAKLVNCNLLMNDSSIVFEDFNYTLGKGSEIEVSTASVSTNIQKQNLTIRIENLAPHSIGNIINYGITKDTAHLAFNGIGKIHKSMNGVDNQQETRILNLSKKSEAVANPFLLIDEGDITAGHAATIGQVNEEQLYYLMSRGLTRVESEKAIALGFLTPFIDNNIENSDLRKELLGIIQKKLG